jgi:SPP1 gp7 family putative phage head morphogenesis protein
VEPRRIHSGNALTRRKRAKRPDQGAGAAKALDDGGTLRDVKNAIRSLPELNDERAVKIARTEASFANGRATQAAFKSRGVARKQWLNNAGADDERAGLDGEIVDVDAAFSNGEMAPPAHPQCVCTMLPVRED